MADFENLKPCPFCGSKKIIFHEYDHIVHLPGGYIEKYHRFMVDCMGCGASMNSNRVKNISKAWNKRAAEEDE